MAMSDVFTCCCFSLRRILSRIQAGASNVRSYWQAHGSSIRGLVRVRRPHSGKVVTLHFVTAGETSVAVLLQASRGQRPCSDQQTFSLPQ